jgi:hypothetical protein
MCPSTAPLLHGSLTADFNAFRSLFQSFKVRTKRTNEWMPVFRPGHCCFKKSTICAWWPVTRWRTRRRRTRERKRASESPRQQRSICCDSKLALSVDERPGPLSTGLRSRVPDSSSQRENLISLFGPNLLHRPDTMVRTKVHERARQGIERLITERALSYRVN